MENENGEVGPVPTSTATGAAAVEEDTLTNILKNFHDIWGGCKWTDEDKIRKQIEALPDMVRQDEAYQNAMRYSDAQNARDESERATFDAIMNTMASGMELFTAFQDDVHNANNQSFRKWLLDTVFNATYQPPNQINI